MTISEEYRQPCGEWHPTPKWLLWLGKPPYRRALYAWPQIGGGWDGWEYSAPVGTPGKPL
jgi:hypothetical protein